MASYLGHVVKVDLTTLSTLWGKFASVCVEVDLQKPFTTKLQILDHT